MPPSWSGCWLRSIPRSAGSTTPPILPPGDPASDDFTPAVDGTAPLPFQQADGAQIDVESAMARHRRRRVMLVFRQYRHVGRSLFLADFYRLFADSARDVGIETVSLE
ncbi:MAG: hypothetical protein WDO24_22500 [Pseudomonadota bacterium]